MTPREIAIEAAAKAICDNVCNILGSRGAENQAAMAGFRKDATSAYDAIFAALEAEGGARKGSGIVVGKDGPDSLWSCQTGELAGHFPVLIIKL
jgi:hypothetical protein